MFEPKKVAAELNNLLTPVYVLLQSELQHEQGEAFRDAREGLAKALLLIQESAPARYPGGGPAMIHYPASCGPTMPALLRMRFRQHLRVAIDCWRIGEPDRAWYHLGIASGQAYALDDTVVDAAKYSRAVERVSNIFRDQGESRS